MKRVSTCIAMIGSMLLAAEQEQWTWTYRANFKKKGMGSSKILYMGKEKVSPFNQLIFSWNAYRPKRAFTFYVSVHDAQAQKWSEWFKMAEWGQDKQLSHKSPHDEPYNYVYVRMETNKKYADGYKIKVVLSEPGDESLLKTCSVCVSNLSHFTPEPHHLFAMPSACVEGVPLFSQFELDHPKKDALCSPTSCAMVVSYLTKQNSIDPLEFAQGVFDNGLGVFGSWPFNTAHAFEKTLGSFQFEVTRLPSFKHLYAQLRKKMPVIVSVRGPLIGSATAYAGGHLLVVVGWDKEKGEVLCHDPAFFPRSLVAKRYPVKDFLQAWERSRRLAYVVHT